MNSLVCRYEAVLKIQITPEEAKGDREALRAAYNEIALEFKDAIERATLDGTPVLFCSFKRGKSQVIWHKGKAPMLIYYVNLYVQGGLPTRTYKVAAGVFLRVFKANSIPYPGKRAALPVATPEEL